MIFTLFIFFELKNKILGLDILRSIAILLVVIGHGSFMYAHTFLEKFPFVPMVNGVDIFFVLSGFLIGNILLKQLDKGLDIGALKTFYIRRWLRTLPLYYIILFANYCFTKYGFIREDLSKFNWKFFVFLQNFSQPFSGFFWESWSLSIEEWFYLITPIVLLIFLRFLRPKYAFLCSALLLIAFAIFQRWQYSCILNVNEEMWDNYFRKLVLLRVDSIAVGLLTAWLFVYHSTLFSRPRFIYLFMGLLGIYLLQTNSFSINSHFMKIWYYLFVPISIALLIPFLYNVRRINRFVDVFFHFSSKISYAMYLVNLALIAEVIRDNFVIKNPIDGLFKFIIYLILVYFVSSILYYGIEKPILQYRDTQFKD